MGKGYFVYSSSESDELNFANQVCKIYNCITDETSREIYINSILYSMTLDPHYIYNKISQTSIGLEFEKLLDQVAGKPLLIYGAGKRGAQLFQIFPNKNWKGYIDSKKEGYYNGLKIQALEDYIDILDSVIVISNQFGYKQIKYELLNKGIEETNIIVLEEWNQKAAQCQYFEKRCVEKIINEGGFVDVGAFDGTDSIHFFNWVRNNNQKVWAFEPDDFQYKICKQRLDLYQNAKVYNVAVSNKSEKRKMVMMHNMGSYIEKQKTGVEDRGIRITTIALDEILANENVGYIKMDIEGFEEKALLGTENIIREQKPALAVCVYHKREDIWRIPNLLYEFNPDYRFLFGHYSIGQVDTVLYAY